MPLPKHVMAAQRVERQKLFEQVFGQKFGALTVVKIASVTSKGCTYECRCDCGATYVASRRSMLKGDRRSCGCRSADNGRIPLAGQRFGFLVVQSETWSGEDHGHRCICLCHCGKTVQRGAGELKTGHTRSCGCLRRQGGNATAANKIWSQHLNNAKSRGYAQELTRSQYLELAAQPCHYCARIGVTTARQCSRSGEMYGELRYNGVDRVDNAVGYTPANSVTCCRDCNVAKASMSRDEFLSWIEAIYRHSCRKDTLVA